MAMTLDQAYEIKQTMQKLLKLRRATRDSAQQAQIDSEIGTLEPYLDEAGGIVIRSTDDAFAQIAAQVAAQTKPIDDAIADIAKISTGLETAAQIVNTLVAALGPRP